MPKPNVNTMTFAQACAAWYDTADKYAQFGASDTEPRAEFGQIVVDLAEHNAIKVPQTADDWQLYSSTMNCFFAGKALTRAAERVVKVAARVGDAQVEDYARAQGWYW